MFEYSANNHFKWGFGDAWHNDPDAELTFKIRFGHCTRLVKSFRDECILAATHIANKATKPIIVGLSGGFDSQIACLSFLKAGADLSTVIVKYYDNGVLINQHDIKTAYQFCKKFNVKYIEFNLNLSEFYQTKALEYGSKYGFRNVEPIVQCATMDYVGEKYCYIMAGGDPMVAPMLMNTVPDRDLPSLSTHIPNMSVAVWSQRPQPIMQHMIKMGYEGTSKFFLYTPELITSYLKHSALQDFLLIQEPIYDTWCRGEFNNPKFWWKCFHYMYKPLMVIKEWPEVIQIRKYTGFEKLYTTSNNEGKIFKYLRAIKECSNKLLDNQAVILTIPEFTNYLETPYAHDLLATRIIE